MGVAADSSCMAASYGRDGSCTSAVLTLCSFRGSSPHTINCNCGDTCMHPHRSLPALLYTMLLGRFQSHVRTFAKCTLSCCRCSHQRTLSKRCSRWLICPTMLSGRSAGIRMTSPAGMAMFRDSQASSREASGDSDGTPKAAKTVHNFSACHQWQHTASAARKAIRWNGS